jgi:hypothetical protein
MLLFGGLFILVKLINLLRPWMLPRPQNPAKLPKLTIIGISAKINRNLTPKMPALISSLIVRRYCLFKLFNLNGPEIGNPIKRIGGNTG